MRKGRHPSRVTQTGALRKAKCEEKEKGDRCQKTSDAARTPFFLGRTGFVAKQKSQTMELKAEIQDAVKTAMKSGDSVTLSTLRLLLSAIQYEEIKARKELNAEEIQKTVSTLSKQRTEAIELFRKGGREDLAKKEEAELKILQHFLPQPLTETEVQNLIRESIDEVGAQGVQDLGKVMKRVMPKLGGRSDGKRVNEMARALLGE